MYRCAQCGATLQKEKQICPRCSDQRAAPVLPTLFGFGEESMEDAQKTIQMTHRPEHSPRKSTKTHQTSPLISPIPAIPDLSKYDSPIDHNLMSFATDDSTEVTSRQSHFNKGGGSDLSDQKAEAIEAEYDIDFTMSEGFEDHFSDIEVEPNEVDEDFAIAIPPPIPPPSSDSMNSVDLRKIVNPFAAPKKQQIDPSNNKVQPVASHLSLSPTQNRERSLKSYVLWFSQQGSIRQTIRQQEVLILPNTPKKLAKVHLNDQDFSFEGALNQEIWQPIKDKMEMTQNDTLRSGSLVMKWVEMTVENTEVISQPSMAIWEVKANQERVFYGAFNLFPGISRVGGELCEISLPFVKTRGPIFTVELDLNGHLWCRSYAQSELWSLIQSEDRFAYGQILATQGKLFTITKDHNS